MTFDDYALLDCGGGRKLERFGAAVVDRPAPQATHPPAAPGMWADATARFIRSDADRKTGRWEGADRLPDPWRLRLGPVTLGLDATPTGQVGVFPEQAPNWRRLRETVAAAPAPVRVLNLFAHTGAATLFAASAQPTGEVEVCHVDAARSVVRRARENARLSSLDDRPVRWIAEDALRFLERERRRGVRYDGFILDPPAFGRGGGRNRWKLARDLPRLLEAVGRVASDRPAFALLTAHAPELPAADLGAALAGLPFDKTAAIETGDLIQTAASGATLPGGRYAHLRTGAD